MTSTCMHVKYAVRHTLTHMSLYIHGHVNFWSVSLYALCHDQLSVY